MEMHLLALVLVIVMQREHLLASALSTVMITTLSAIKRMILITSEIKR
jgi:hypothetical protein